MPQHAQKKQPSADHQAASNLEPFSHHHGTHEDQQCRGASRNQGNQRDQRQPMAPNPNAMIRLAGRDHLSEISFL